MRKSSEDRILFLVKSRGPITAGMAGKALKMTTAGAQQHLAALRSKGFVEPEEQRQPRGRPLKYWRLTEKGHGRFPDRHGDLTVEILRSARDVFGPEGLEALVRHREERIAFEYAAALRSCENLREKVRMLAWLRTGEGYLAEWSETEPGSYLLVENHCPIRAAAAACQGLCRSELAIFQTVLGPEVAVERAEHILSGARRCAYRIAPAGDVPAPPVG